VFERLKPMADPGFPLRNIARTNKELISFVPDFIKDCVIARLMLYAGDTSVSELTALQLVAAGFADPVRVFVKNEPHTREKLQDQRVRLIMSVSMVDQLVDRILFNLQNKTDIFEWRNTPSKGGAGFIPDHINEIISYVEKMPNPASSDCSGWDWSVQGWDYKWEAEFRILLARAPHDSLFAKIVRKRQLVHSLSLFVLGDGTLFQQEERGIMKSGQLNTFSMNSRTRAANHVVVAVRQDIIPAVMTAGDDAVETKLKNETEEYLKLGKRIIVADVSPDTFEFCSHEYNYSTRKAHSQNAGKMTFALLSKGGGVFERSSLLEDWRREMDGHPQRAHYEQLIRDSGWFQEQSLDTFATEQLYPGLNLTEIGSVEVIDQNLVSSANQNAKRLHGSPYKPWEEYFHRISSVIDAYLSYLKCAILLLLVISFLEGLKVYGFSIDVQSRLSLRHPIQMTNKQKPKQKKMAASSNHSKSGAIKAPKGVPRGQPEKEMINGRPVFGPENSNNKIKKANKGPAMPQFAIAQIDPFTKAAYGCKVNDESTAESIVAVSHNEVSMSTGNSYGGTGIVFMGDAVASYVGVGAVSSSTAWAYAASFANTTQASNITALQNNVAELRTVAWGLKINSRQSFTNASGVVHIAQVPVIFDSNSTTYQFPTTVAQMEYSSFYKRVPIADLIESELIVTGRYTDTSAFMYRDPNLLAYSNAATNSYIATSTGWMAIVVWIEAPISTTNAIDVEQIVHYECMPKETGGTAGILTATPAAPHSPTIMAATSYVQQCLPSVKVVSPDNEDDFWSIAKDAWNVGVKIANGVATMAEMAGTAVAMFA
jgi:hypothetical protein